MLRDFKKYKLLKAQCGYFPILDRNPQFAAKFLTKKDLKKAYDLMKEVYKEIKKGKKYREILYDTVMDSSQNFIWFATFFKEMEKILKVEEEFDIPYDKIPKNSLSENRDEIPHVSQPFKVSSYSASKPVCITKVVTNVKEQNPINNYRIMYISQDYDMSEFQDDCYPGWYLIKDTTVFEQYNEKTNTRVRIDFRNGEFMYFIAGASDNWQPIPDVPIEMDHIISALLFRNLNN